MKTVLLLLVLLVSSCTPTENVSYIKKIGMSENGPIFNITIDGHDYVDCVVFVLDNFKWQEKLENISRGMLSELIHCLNNKKSFYIAYRSTDGLNIYGAQITPDLVFSGIAGTKGNIFKLQDSEPVLQTFGKLYFDSTAKVIPGVTKVVDKMDELGINYELEETPKPTNSYFY